MIQSRHLRLVLFLSLGALVVGAHALLIACFPSSGFAISYPFWTGCTILSATVVLWHAFHRPPTARVPWLLAAASLLCTLIAALIEAPAEILYSYIPNAASIGDFFFFFAFIPILLAIALPEEGYFVLSTFLLDCIQAAAAGYLAYAALFGALPFTGATAHPMEYKRLLTTYDSEYLVLVALVTIRPLAGARSSRERYYYRSLALYVWLYAITSSIYNHINGQFSNTSPLDAVNDIPSLAFAICVLFAPRTVPSAMRRADRPTFVRLIDNARPIFLSLSIVALGAIVVKHHLAAAMTCILIAFVLYGIRSSMLQSNIQRAQLALERASDRLAEIALQDGLTGIPNRRAFDERLQFEWTRSRRTGQPLSLLLVDVDHFKQVNDTHGHLIGDDILRHSAHLLRIALERPADFPSRYGGEEFAILLPETPMDGALLIADRIRASFALTSPPCEGACPITVSVGVTTWDTHLGSSPEQLLATADKALYHAKQNGRNRVEFLELQPLTAR